MKAKKALSILSYGGDNGEERRFKLKISVVSVNHW